MLQRDTDEFPTMDSVDLLEGTPVSSPTPPELPAGPADPPPRRTAHRRRALLLLVAAGLVVGLWWGSGYVVAYTDDAYVDSDVVQVTPEVAGPIEAVHVRDNQWIKRGSILFTIDPTPFKLELQQAIAKEEQAKAKLPVDKATIESLGAQKEAADEAARLGTINLGRVTPLTTEGFASKQTYDNTLTAQQQSVAQQHNAEATLEKAKQTLQLHQVAVATAHAARLYAEWRLSRTDVTAPVDGQITNLTLARGDFVSPGRPALAIVDASAWRVIANYKEYYLRRLPPGARSGCGSIAILGISIERAFRVSRMRSAETGERARSCPTCHRQWIGSVSTGASRSACS